MLATTDLYNSLWDGENQKEVKLVIAGTEYTMENLVSVSVTRQLFEELSIGNAASGQINLQILPLGEIPRQARVEVFVRLTDGDKASEWIPKGVYFFKNRDTDKLTGVMTVHGYDAMLKAEANWLDSSYNAENWPMPVWSAVNDIAARMGVEVDRRTVLDERFPVAYPINADGDITMREALRKIAVANAGNWIMSDEGKLLLVGLNSIPIETSLLVNEKGYDITFGGYAISVG